MGSKEGRSGGMVAEGSHGDVQGCTDSSLNNRRRQQGI